MTTEKIYSHVFTLEQLNNLEDSYKARFLEPDSDASFTRILNSQDIHETLASIGFPVFQMDNITGILALISGGDYVAIWCTESNAPYESVARYHPLPYYRHNASERYYPSYYWRKTNEFYQINVTY